MDWEVGLIAPLAFRDGAEDNAHWSYCATNAAARLAPPGGSAATRCEGRRFRLPTSHRRSGRPIQNNSSLSQGRRRPLAGTLGLVKRRSSRRVQANGERSWCTPICQVPGRWLYRESNSPKISLLVRTWVNPRPWRFVGYPQWCLNATDRPHHLAPMVSGPIVDCGRSRLISKRFRSAPRTRCPFPGRL